MEDMLVRQNRMARDTVQERLQQSLPTSNKNGVFFGLSLLDSVITDRLLRRDRGNDKRGVEPR